jgi:Spy/CpxP family protein refolding chaperone
MGYLEKEVRARSCLRLPETRGISMRYNTKARWQPALSVALLAVGAASCDPGDAKVAPNVEKSAQVAAPEPASQVEDKAQVTNDRPARKKLGDPLLGVIYRAVTALPLTPDQRGKMAAMQGSLEDPQNAAYHARKKEFYDALSKAVESGAFDKSALRHQIAAVKAAKMVKYESRTELMVNMHDLLTPEQRQSVATTAREWLAALGDTPSKKRHFRKQGPPSAHGAEGGCPCGGKGGCPHAEAGGCPHTKAGGCPNAKEGGCPHAEADGEGCPHLDVERKKESDCPYAKKHGRFHLRGIMAQLDLTPEQQKEAAAIAERTAKIRQDDANGAARWQAHRAHYNLIIDAFEKEKLDMALLMSRSNLGEHIADKLGREVTHIRELHAILTQSQRQTLARKLADR